MVDVGRRRLGSLVCLWQRGLSTADWHWAYCGDNPSWFMLGSVLIDRMRGARVAMRQVAGIAVILVGVILIRLV